MRRFSTLAIFAGINFLGINLCSAQYLKDLNGKTLRQHNYTEVSGNPFYADWLPGLVKLKNGDTYKNIPLKFNQLDNELDFISKKHDTLTFVDEVVEFQLIKSIDQLEKAKFKNGYKIGSYKPDTFFEVLSDGTVQLLKITSKYIAESKDIGSATINKKILQDIKYFAYKDGQGIAIKKDKKSVLSAINNKQPELEAYIKKENLNLKEDEDLAKVFTYYNSL